MGRTARGVRGIRLLGGHRLIALIVPRAAGYILTASEHGYGKRTQLADFPLKGRGTQGVIAMQVSDRNGAMVAAVQVFDGDELMLISDQGTLVRTKVDSVSLVGRNTQGVRLIAVREDERLVGVARIVEPDDADDTTEVLGVVPDDERPDDELQDEVDDELDEEPDEEPDAE
jgi:DNA gyrase subunit A